MTIFVSPHWPACLSQARPDLPPCLACCSLLRAAGLALETHTAQPSPVQTDRRKYTKSTRDRRNKKIYACGGLGRLASTCGVSAGASDQPTNFVRHHVAVFFVPWPLDERPTS